MMKKFLLIVCGSFVGVFLALMIFSVVSVVMSFAIIGMGANKGAKAHVGEKAILHLDLSGVIEERGSDSAMDFVGMMQGTHVESTGLNTLVAALSNAKDNEDVKGVYIECNGVMANPATLSVLRRALQDFKKSGKFVYAYGYMGYTQGDYYVASVADSLFLNPEGAVDIHGLASATPYPKKLLDKLGVEMQVVRVGTFKSAVEPYMVYEMSDANRLQQEVYLGNIWKNISDSIITSRKLNAEAFKTLADGVLVTMAADSLVKNKLVDRLVYRNEMEDRLKALTEVGEDEDLNLVTPGDLAGDLEAEASGNKIAVLYAVGEIDGADSQFGGNTGIDSEEIAEAVLELAKDDDVKGLVLRVNSPGGSAFGSEQMWKALEDFKKTGKKLAVSMGDYAASGGYYISCNADRIFAEPTTITGSIGIFGVIPCFQQLAEEKLGISTFVVKTNENADMGISNKRLTPVQLAAIQNTVDRGYDTFTKHCADGRHVTQDTIKVIAEGRVWDGQTAKTIGLVDELGGLQEAIKWVAKSAGLKDGDYSTQNYPAPADEFQTFMDMINTRSEARMQQEMGFFYEYYKQVMGLLNRDHMLCIMEQQVVL